MTATAEFTAAPPLSGPSAIAAFERDFALNRRRARVNWAIGAVLFFVVFLLTAWIGDFFKVTQVTLRDGSREWRWIIGAGLPRLGEFITKTFPVLRWDSLGADLAEWFWRWQTWLRLLVETILIAFMATVFGVIGGFLMSFPASRNLSPNRYVLWISRGLATLSLGRSSAVARDWALRRAARRVKASEILWPLEEDAPASERSEEPAEAGKTRYPDPFAKPLNAAE